VLALPECKNQNEEHLSRGDVIRSAFEIALLELPLRNLVLRYVFGSVGALLPIMSGNASTSA
jgi:hypothetical protein